MALGRGFGRAVCGGPGATVRPTRRGRHEILERAASIFEGLRNYYVAQTLLENALAITQSAAAAKPPLMQQVLVKLGDLSYKRREYDEAAAFYTSAVALGDRSVPETVGRPGARNSPLHSEQVGRDPADL